MKVIPFVHEGLGNSSYLVVGPRGEGLLVDPDRSIQRYIGAAAQEGIEIVAVLETHLHADFVTGAREFAADLGIPAFVPELAEWSERTAICPGEELELGGVRVSAIASPGHTPEHLSYALIPPGGSNALFTGGSLIVGGAARTDLISAEVTDDLTRAQYRTLHEAFADYPDETLVYPTHGGGSFCSASAGDGQRTTTLGGERAQNPWLQLDEGQFMREFPESFPSAPDYFFRLRPLNLQGPRLRREIEPPRALAPAQFHDAARAGATTIDLRGRREYASGHIEGSINIAFRPAYATWLGWVVPANAKLLFVGSGPEVEAAVDESLLVGYESFEGWLDGALTGWEEAGLPVVRTSMGGPAEADKWLQAGAIALDVREPAEVAGGKLGGAINIPLGKLALQAGALPGQPIVVYCGHGERSSTAVSLLERAGRREVLNLDGGYAAFQDHLLRHSNAH